MHREVSHQSESHSTSIACEEGLRNSDVILAQETEVKKYSWSEIRYSYSDCPFKDQKKLGVGRNLLEATAT